MNVAAWWKNRPQGESARDLLRDEVDSNLAQLQEFWKKVKPRKPDEESHRVDKVRYASEFALTSLPAFSHSVYLDQQSSWSRHVSDTQATRLAHFYQSLDKIAAIQQRLRETREKDIAVQEAQGEAASLTYDGFLEIAPWDWMEAKRLMQELMEQGNPLR